MDGTGGEKKSGCLIKIQIFCKEYKQPNCKYYKPLHSGSSACRYGFPGRRCNNTMAIRDAIETEVIKHGYIYS